MFSIRFLGASRNVTGSKHLLTYNEKNFLIDCGIYQERQLLSRNWEKFPVEPSTIKAIFLTHAHLDHCGFLPCLVRDGFKGKIYATAPTIEITKIVLLDAAKIYQEDSEKKIQRHQRTGIVPEHPVVPLFTIDQAYDVFDRFEEIPYDDSFQIEKGLNLICHNAGHILGSTILEFRDIISGQNLVFTGDLGRPNRHVLPEPERFSHIDHLVMESTYGNRIHEADSLAYETIAETITETANKGGNIVVPSFAIERTQEFLYCLKHLLAHDRIPHLWIFLDSPMAIRITEVFKQYIDFLSPSLQTQYDNPFEMSHLRPTESVEESKSINHVKGSVIIIAGSGMCTGGRIKHHLITNISRPESTIMFIGYQANGTLGKEIISGKKQVRILGEYREVKANVIQINGFSSHADQNEILWWLSPVENTPSNTFLVHGEDGALETLKQILYEKKSIKADIADYGMGVTL